MHILSKLCLGLALILGFVGTYVATQVAKKRNAIAETVVAEKKKRDANVDQISKLKITRQLELDELNRLQADWGRQWTAKAVLDPMSAGVVLNIGLQQGFGVQVPNRPEEVYYLFAAKPDGTSQYLGEFNVQGRGAQTALVLNRKPFIGELANWPQDAEVRVRERIPPGIRGIFHDFATNQTVADQIKVNETAKLQIQDNHIAASQKTLDRRLAELNGDPAAPQNADREIVSGLVDTLRVEEAQRNAILKDVDALRRDLSDRYSRLERVLAENKQAVDSLATGTETAATPARAAN